MNNIRLYIAALLLTVSSMAKAQVAEPYLNVQLEDRSYRSFPVTADLEISWGKNMELTKEFNINIGTNPELIGKTVTVVLENGHTYVGTITSDGKLDILVSEADKGQATSKIVYGNVDGSGNPIVPTSQPYVDGGYAQSSMPLVGELDGEGKYTFSKAGAVATIPGQKVSSDNTVTLTYKVNGQTKTVTMTNLPDGTNTNDLAFVIEPGATGLVLDRGDHTGFATIKPEPTFTAGSTPSITGCNWVQLSADGPKWAEFNVGVTDGKATSYGGYYAWGGSQDKVDDHNEGSEDLKGDNDTATKLWGNNWRMPTLAELETLAAGLTWTESYKESGITGFVFTGQGNSLFLPAAGYYSTTKGTIAYQGTGGRYYSSTFRNDLKAPGLLSFNFSPSENECYYVVQYFFYGCPVRAVIND